MSNQEIEQAFIDGTRIDRAMTAAKHAAVRLHRMHGLPMAFWEDGRVVYVDPHTIEIPEDTDPVGFRDAKTRRRRAP
jgi:hypothetical protein